MLHRSPTDKLAHDRVAAQPVGVIDVLVPGKARENRLPQEPGEAMPTIPASAGIDEQIRPHVSQAKGVIEFAVEQQAAVRTDR